MLVTFTFLCIISVVLLTNCSSNFCLHLWFIHFFLQRKLVRASVHRQHPWMQWTLSFQGCFLPTGEVQQLLLGASLQQVGSGTTVLLSALQWKLLRMLLMTKAKGCHHISWQQLWAGAAAATAQQCVGQTGSNTEPGNSQSELCHPAPMLPPDHRGQKKLPGTLAGHWICANFSCLQTDRGKSPHSFRSFVFC